MKQIFILAFILFNIIKLNAQSPCGADEYDAFMKRTNPTYTTERQRHKDYIYQKVSNIGNARNSLSNCLSFTDDGAIYTLPVVFHIIDTSGTTIATDAQIIQGLEVLNNCWRRVVGDGVDLKIQFALAKRDPQGNSTTGINHVNGRSIFGYLQNGVYTDSNKTLVNAHLIQDLIYWPQYEYINIYVVTKISFAAGFASLPSGVGKQSIFISSDAFGALTHEMGHYFDLYHTFDLVYNVNDCPEQDNINNCLLKGDYICDTHPHKVEECSSTTCVGNGDLNNSFKNYMSYCGSSRFTQGQKDRVRATLFGEYRVNLISSPAFIPYSTAFEDVKIDSILYTEDLLMPLCDHKIHPQVKLKNKGTILISSVKIATILDGNIINTTTYPVNISSNGSQLVSLPAIAFTVAGSRDLSFQLLKINNNRIDYDTLNNQLCTTVNPLVFSDTITTIAEPPAGGSIIGGKIFKCNGIDTLKVSINSCYNFLGIYKNNIWGGSDDFITLDSIYYYPIDVNEYSETNIIFKAKFEIKRYLISGYPSPSNNYGSVYGGGQYDCGTLINLLARPRTGYKFLNWTRNGIVYSTDSILSFTAAENLNLLAVFSLATGIKQSTINEISKIYPNPANEILQIEIRSKQNTSLTLNIIDMKGSLLETKTLTNTKGTFNTSFDVSKLSKGNYILNLYDEEGIASYKFIVQ